MLLLALALAALMATPLQLQLQLLALRSLLQQQQLLPLLRLPPLRLPLCLELALRLGPHGLELAVAAAPVLHATGLAPETPLHPRPTLALLGRLALFRLLLLLVEVQQQTAAAMRPQQLQRPRGVLEVVVSHWEYARDLGLLGSGQPLVTVLLLLLVLLVLPLLVLPLLVLPLLLVEARHLSVAAAQS
jgi:hypothetical protein